MREVKRKERQEQRRMKKKGSEMRNREEEKEENETVTVKSKRSGLSSVEALEIFSQGGDVESCGGLSWEGLLEEHDDMSDSEPDSCAQVRVVRDVTDVLVSPSSVVTEFCDGFSCCSGWEMVEPQSFSFSKKRAHCCADTQEVMMYGGSPVKAPPLSRRRMTPPTPVQNSYNSFEREQGSFEGEGRGKNARVRTTTARTTQFLERSYRVKVRVEALEALLGPEDVDVDLRRILEEARDDRGRKFKRHEFPGG